MNENRPCCCRKKNVRTKTVSLKFKRSELLYDCANLGYVHGDTMHTDDEHDRHQVMDIVEDGNVDRVTRILNLVMSEVREALYPYTKVEAENGDSREDTLTEVEEYTISMLVPDEFSSTTQTYLENLIHELLVDRVMADWCSITYPEKEGIWRTKADEVLRNINKAKNFRMGKKLRPLHPW